MRGRGSGRNGGEDGAEGQCVITKGQRFSLLAVHHHPTPPACQHAHQALASTVYGTVLCRTGHTKAVRRARPLGQMARTHSQAARWQPGPPSRPLQY
jgi:hypothetical protein